MDELVCENCGSKHLIEVNGIVTCQACGTKYPDLELNKIGIKEEAKEQEIKRLIEVSRKTFTSSFSREPALGILTDDEILQYAPNSEAAKKVMFKRTGKLKYKSTDIFTFVFLILFPLNLMSILFYNVLGNLGLIILLILNIICILIFYKIYLIPEKS